MSALLEVRDLQVAYGHIEAVQGISFEVHTGEKVGLMRVIAQIAQRGFTIFMIEHDMRFVMGLCERIAVLNFGKIIAEGAPDEIRNNADVIEAYLGRDDDADNAVVGGSQSAR